MRPVVLRQGEHLQGRFRRLFGPVGHEGEIVSGAAFAAKGSGFDAFDAEGGDTVKLVAHPDPAKTDFVQEDAVIEVTAE